MNERLDGKKRRRQSDKTSGTVVEKCGSDDTQHSADGKSDVSVGAGRELTDRKAINNTFGAR